MMSRVKCRGESEEYYIQGFCRAATRRSRNETILSSITDVQICIAYLGRIVQMLVSRKCSANVLPAVEHCGIHRRIRPERRPGFLCCTCDRRRHCTHATLDVSPDPSSLVCLTHYMVQP
eukprot:SAG11_NODE_3838_length_2195_cov_2.830153_1_plen_119_part_00